VALFLQVALSAAAFRWPFLSFSSEFGYGFWFLLSKRRDCCVDCLADALSTVAILAQGTSSGWSVSLALLEFQFWIWVWFLLSKRRDCCVDCLADALSTVAILAQGTSSGWSVSLALLEFQFWIWVWFLVFALKTAWLLCRLLGRRFKYRSHFGSRYLLRLKRFAGPSCGVWCRFLFFYFFPHHRVAIPPLMNVTHARRAGYTRGKVCWKKKKMISGMGRCFFDLLRVHCFQYWFSLSYRMCGVDFSVCIWRSFVRAKGAWSVSSALSSFRCCIDRSSVLAVMWVSLRVCGCTSGAFLFCVLCVSWPSSYGALWGFLTVNVVRLAFAALSGMSWGILPQLQIVDFANCSPSGPLLVVTFQLTSVSYCLKVEIARGSWSFDKSANLF